MSSFAEMLLSIEDRVYKNVSVPEWKDKDGKALSCRIRSWTAGDRGDFDAESALLSEHLSEGERSALATPRIVAWSLVDDAGSLVFELPPMSVLESAVKDKRLKAVLQVYYDLAAKNGKALQRIVSVATKLNALSEKDEIDIEKN